MVKRILTTLGISLALFLCASAQAGPLLKAPTSAPAGQASAAPDAPRKGASFPKFQPATQEEIALNRRRATMMYQEARKFAPSIHLIETPHFVIYSTYPRTSDKQIAALCEKMYKTLCSQFGIPAKGSIFAGKCPVYVFDRIEDFRKFTTDVDSVKLALAGGYHYQQNDGFAYIVLNRTKSMNRFYELLTHEGTHAFQGRYLTNGALPMWVGEGMAEYFAGTLVKSSATKRYTTALREAAKKKRDLSQVMDKVELTEFDYGIAQAFVRYLVKRDPKAFVRFITLLKSGRGEDEALHETYKLDRKALVKAVTAAAASRRVGF